MNETPTHRFRQVAAAEASAFFPVFLYVWFLLAVFGLHKSIVLSEAHIIQHQGVAILKALAFAKILFIAEKMHIGEIFRERPLVFPVLYKSAVFAVVLILMDLLEKVLIDRFWPSMAARGSGDDIDTSDLRILFSVGFLTFAALIPFFGLRELSKVLGEAPMLRLFFVRREKFVPVREEVRPESVETLDETDE